MPHEIPDQDRNPATASEREDALRARLARAEETLRAIRSGEVDALVVATPEGDRVFTLRGADEPYRIMLEQMSEGAASLSSNQIVLYANRRLAQMLATPLPTLIGAPIDQFITAEQQPALADLFDGPADERRRSGEFTLLGHEGRRVDAHISLTPLPDSTGAAWCMIATDVTERAQHLAAIVESSVDAIISLNTGGVIETWNPGAERLYGHSAREAVGQHALTLLAANAAEREPLLKSVVETGNTVQTETEDVRKDGRLIDVSVTDSPIRDPDGQVIGIARTARDVTERNRAEREREQTLAELEKAERLARLGSWSWDPSSDAVTWSAQMYEIFARDPARDPATGEELIAYVHPGDRDRVGAALASTLAGGPGFQLEHRIIAGDAVRRTVRATVQADLTRSGCYVGTIQDITEQRRAETERIELLAASARAESANRAKSEFLARMSHELRTPLNSIVGFTQLVELDGLEPRQREHVGYVLKAASHLLALINEVLELERIETDQLSILPEPVALAGMVREALALLAPLARDRHVTLRTNTDGLAHDRHVLADHQRLKQVLLNLLSNAIKYNRPGGRVDVSFAMTDTGRVRATIADTGIGIAPDQLPKLFEPFERLGAEHTDVEGTGLGLALSKGLIEAMAGTIEVDSTLGIGSAFTVELATAPRPTTEHKPSDPELAQLDDERSPRKLILYIEDNLSGLTLVERILGRYPAVELLPAMQATIGLELAREHHPDLIVLDLHLPDMPGTEVLERLKADQSTREIPVVVLTADASSRQSERVMQLGAAAYLTKPLDIPRFLEVIVRGVDPKAQRDLQPLQ